MFLSSYVRLVRLISLSEPVWLWLNLLGGACMSMWAGPLKRSKKESGLSVSSTKLFCAHSLRVITILTILNTGQHTCKDFNTGHQRYGNKFSLNKYWSGLVHSTAVIPGQSTSPPQGILGINISSVIGRHSLKLWGSVITHRLCSTHINNPHKSQMHKKRWFSDCYDNSYKLSNILHYILKWDLDWTELSDELMKPSCVDDMVSVFANCCKVFVLIQ